MSTGGFGGSGSGQAGGEGGSMLAMLDPTMFGGIPTVSGVGYQDAFNSYMQALGAIGERGAKAADDVFALVGQISNDNVKYLEQQFARAQNNLAGYSQYGQQAAQMLLGMGGGGGFGGYSGGFGTTSGGTQSYTRQAPTYGSPTRTLTSSEAELLRQNGFDPNNPQHVAGFLNAIQQSGINPDAFNADMDKQLQSFQQRTAQMNAINDQMRAMQSDYNNLQQASGAGFADQIQQMTQNGTLNKDVYDSLYGATFGPGSNYANQTFFKDGGQEVSQRAILALQKQMEDLAAGEQGGYDAKRNSGMGAFKKYLEDSILGKAPAPGAGGMGGGSGGFGGQGGMSGGLGQITQMLQTLSPQYARLANTSPEAFANSLMNSLMGQGGAVQNATKQYTDSMMKYGQQAIEGSAASKGMLDSGRTLANLQDYGMGVAGQYVLPAMQNALNQGMASGNNQANNIWGSLNQVSSLYGIQQQALSNVLSAGANSAAGMSQAAQNQGTAVAGQRNIQMEGQGNAIMSKANALNQSQMATNQLLMQGSSMPYFANGMLPNQRGGLGGLNMQNLSGIGGLAMMLGGEMGGPIGMGIGTLGTLAAVGGSLFQ